MRVRLFTQLFSAAKCLASRYRPVGKRLAVVTNGGGPGVLAADWANEASFYQNQQLLQQTPPPNCTLAKPDIEGARRLIEAVLAERRKVLTEMDSKALLAAFHIPMTRTLLARSAYEAMLIAAQLG